MIAKGESEIQMTGFEEGGRGHETRDAGDPQN
jgi:hypothetical protein